jgi:hypothetical protein
VAGTKPTALSKGRAFRAGTTDMAWQAVKAEGIKKRKKEGDMWALSGVNFCERKIVV